MKGRLEFEFFRVFNVINVPIFIVFFIASLYLVNKAIIEYNQVRESNKTFASLEKQKSALFVTYEQYGVFGFKIIGEADPMIIFFSHSTPLNDLESKIDVLENVNIGSTAKGKAIFKNKSHFKDLFGLLNVFGSFLMFLLGLFSHKSQAFFMEKKRFSLKGLMARLLWIDGYFFALMSIVFLIALMKGVPFTASHTKLYLAFELNTIIFLNTCFIIGYIIAASIKSRYINISLTIIAWFFCIFILPEWRYPDIQGTDVLSASELDLIKFENIRAKEKAIREIILPLLKDSKRDPNETRAYHKKLVMEFVNDGYTKNNALEYELQEQIKSIVLQCEMKSLWTPFSFNLLISESLSSRGYQYYISYVDHILFQKNRFFLYYIEKRYNSNDQTVIPITRDGDFIYKSKSVLPNVFWKGILVQFLYSITLIIILQIFLILKEKQKSKNKIPVDLNQVKNSNSFFWECKEREGLNKYLNYFESIDGITVIDVRRISNCGIDTPLIFWIKYVCNQKKYALQDILKRLEKLGIPIKEFKKIDISIKPETIKKNAEKLKMVYLVLKTMEESSLYVIYNLFKGETQEFEEICKKYLAGLGKMVLYISNEAFRQKGISSKLIKSINIYDDNISLR